MATIDSSFEELCKHFDETLNADKSTFRTSNDHPTPTACVGEMIDRVPEELWNRKNLSILDPCCGNGNFFVPILTKLMAHGATEKQCMEEIFEFNDINTDRLDVVRKVFRGDKYKLKITEDNFLTTPRAGEYDLIVANPPYAKLDENGKRASKNHNLIKAFLGESLKLLKPGGYLVFITPNNWMSYADRNTLIMELTKLQIIHLDIHSAKKHFKKIGSSFTWYVIENRPFYKDINVSGIWNKEHYECTVKSGMRRYIPLFFNRIIQGILAKTVDNAELPKFKVETSSDLHKYTKRDLIRPEQCKEFQYRLIHTPKQTVYASRPHKFQSGYKVFMSTTDKYRTWVDNCGMTQSIVFIRCPSKEEADRHCETLNHPLYRFINSICRWGNFNNIRILQSFPQPSGPDVYDCLGITEDERNYIESLV